MERTILDRTALDRRTFGITLALAVPALATGASAQTAWPTKPVHIIVASTPGSSPDVLARMLAKEL